jgi:hypothetical protein
MAGISLAVLNNYTRLCVADLKKSNTSFIINTLEIATELGTSSYEAGFRTAHNFRDFIIRKQIGSVNFELSAYINDYVICSRASIVQVSKLYLMSAFVKNRSNQNCSFGLYRANKVSVAAFTTRDNELSGFIELRIFKKDSRHAVCLIEK